MLISTASRARLGAALAALTVLLGPQLAQAADKDRLALDCQDTMRAWCLELFAGADRFEPVEGQPYQVALDAAGDAVGWVILSTDAVDIDAYSGEPLVTLVGLNPDAVITGARVIRHSEPIVLVGLPENALQDFVAFYAGKPATTKVVVGSTSDDEAIAVDVISGATVTALAQNQTVLETARLLGDAVGVIESEHSNRGYFISEDEPWSWARMVDEGVLGRLTVTEADMDPAAAGDTGAFVDIWFTIADAPQVGRALLGERGYAHHKERLQEGEHLVVILGNGSSSFKGSGFVRGGIFDRIRIEQGLRTVIFRDHDYTPIGRVAAADAPNFKEGGVFIARDGRLDPGAPANFIFVGSRYTYEGGFARKFIAFQSTLQLPGSVYFAIAPPERDLDAEIYRQAWHNNRFKVAALGVFLLFVMGLFVARGWLTANMRRLQLIHITVMAISFVGLGLVLKAQPSVTQVLTLASSVTGEWRWGLFLSEPLLFTFWIVIAIVVVVWGRGVFCGWTCPYGAMTELLYKLGRKLRIPELIVPERPHRYARYGRYVALAVLVGVFLQSPETGERMAEIEPFKSTFFIAPWTREWYFAGWWLLLAGWAVFTWRPFCQYLCPLGAALAIPGSLRASGPLRRRFCSSCKICTRGCEPRAIRSDGSIDPRDCLSCMECEANFRDEETCPPLIGLEKLRIGQARGVAPAAAKLERLEYQAERVRRPRVEGGQR